MNRATIVLAVTVLMAALLGGCSTAIGFGDEDGFGVKTTIAKDGKIFALEGTDGNGR